MEHILHTDTTHRPIIADAHKSVTELSSISLSRFFSRGLSVDQPLEIRLKLKSE